MRGKLPKVLIISEFFFGERTGGGILLKNLFQDYPEDKIFIVHEETDIIGNHKVKSFSLKSKNKLGILLKKILPGRFIQILIRIKNLIWIRNKNK